MSVSPTYALSVWQRNASMYRRTGKSNGDRPNKLRFR